MRKVVIIGAGIGGLATANILAKAGLAVTVVEQASGPGGRAGIWRSKGFTFDTGPSWYLMPEVFAHYYSLLGERVEDHLDLVKLDPAYKVFFEAGQPVTIHADLAQDKRTFEDIEPGAGGQLEQYLARSGKIYELARQHFLYNNFQPGLWPLRAEIMRHLPLMARLGGKSIHDYIRRYVHDLRLQQILAYPMVFLGASPYNAPAMYSLMSHMDFTQGVFYPQGGMYTIITSLEAIGRKLGVQYRYNAAVTGIPVARGQAAGVLLQGGEQLPADLVISNADLHFTETRLLPEGAQTYPERYWQKRTAAPSALLLYLGVKGNLPQLAHHSLLFAKDWRANFGALYDTKTWPHPASMYVCRPSATDPSVAPAGHENLFVLVPIPAGMPARSQESHADRYLQQLSTMIGAPDLASRLVVHRVFGPDDFAGAFNSWQNTALGLSHTLRQSAFFRPANRSRKVSNLYYVGANTVPGIGLPMCLIGAELIYKRLTGNRTAGPLPGVITEGDLQ